MNNIIAIGGLGGSGTRVYAEILQRLGYFIGHDLNAELDNLLFSRLFKNTEWYRNSAKEDIILRISWFKSIMGGKMKTIPSALNQAILTNQTFPTKQYVLNVNNYTSRNQWAWKEPNSHIFLPELASGINNLKYVLVIRDGLDMSLSSNTQQLQNWGPTLFGISYNSDDRNDLIRAQLEYWIAANNRSIKKGRMLLCKNFIVCNFDRLCLDPEFEISRLANFLEMKVTDNMLKDLVSIPRRPASSGRYRSSPLCYSTSVRTKVHRLNGGQAL